MLTMCSLSSGSTPEGLEKNSCKIVTRRTFQIWDRIMEVPPLIGLVLFHQLRHPRGVKPDGLLSLLMLDIRVESVAWNLARHGRQTVVPEMRT